MLFFALCSDGKMFNLGDHGTFDAADETARGLGLEVIWIFDQINAVNAANFIQCEIENEDFCIYGD